MIYRPTCDDFYDFDNDDDDDNDSDNIRLILIKDFAAHALLRHKI